MGVKMRRMSEVREDIASSVQSFRDDLEFTQSSEIRLSLKFLCKEDFISYEVGSAIARLSIPGGRQYSLRVRGECTIRNRKRSRIMDFASTTVTGEAT